MYPPSHHQTVDKEKMIAVMQAYPLAILVTVLDGNPLITHIPIIYNEISGKLVAHIDKFNPQVESLRDGAQVTVVFRGPDSYISPSIYSTKQLPTWNYIIVHITGTISLIKDVDAAKDTMIEMTKFLEGTEQKFILEKENKAMQHFINYIRAFDISITNWEGKFKLSQDKNLQDQENAKQQLIKDSMKDISEFIKKII